MAKREPVTKRKPGETDRVYYYRIAKAADERLKALEKLSGQTGFHEVKNWSYKKAQMNIKRWSGESGKPRFNKKAPESDAELRAKIKDIKEFLEAPSSSKQTIVKSYKHRVNKINKTQGTNLTWQDLANFFESDQNQKVFNKYGSGDTFRVLSAIKNGDVDITVSDQKLAQMIKEGKDISEVIQVEDELVGDKIIEMLQANDLKPGDLH